MDLTFYYSLPIAQSDKCEMTRHEYVTKMKSCWYTTGDTKVKALLVAIEAEARQTLRDLGDWR